MELPATVGPAIPINPDNSGIRDAIDTITSKVVLILGRFTKERKAVLETSRHVDAVIPLDENVTNDFMVKHNFQIRAYGAKNEADEERYFQTLWKDMDRGYFVGIPYTEGISTTDIIARIRNRDDL